MKFALLAIAIAATSSAAQVACTTDELKIAVTSQVLTVAGSVMQCALDIGVAATSVPYPTGVTPAQLAAMGDNLSCQKVYEKVQAGISSISPACILASTPTVVTSTQITEVSYPAFLALVAAGAKPPVAPANATSNSTTGPTITTPPPTTPNPTTVAPTPTETTTVPDATTTTTPAPTSEQSGSAATTIAPNNNDAAPGTDKKGSTSGASSVAAVTTLTLQPGKDLYEAARDGIEAEVARLIQEGTFLEWENYNGDTPLYSAAENGYEGVVRLLIAAGADVDHENERGRTPLSIAPHYSSDAVVRQLIAAGADCNVVDDGLQTPLHRAAELDLVDCARPLIAAGANVNAIDYWLNTPLHYASAYGYDEMVHLLLEAGADPSLKDHEGEIARYYAEEENYTDVLSAFDEALVQAARLGDSSRVRNLLATGVDADASNDRGETPLLAAVTQGHVAIVELLLEAGADPFRTTTDGSPLFVAQRNGHDAVVAVLEKPLKTALLSAVLNSDATKVASVLAQGISADCVLEDGRLPLHVASALGIVEVVQSLMSADANANTGETALHVAVKSARKAIVHLLVDAGADCEVLNPDKLTPMALAETLGLDEIQSFLKAHTRPADALLRCNANDEVPTTSLVTLSIDE
ncbi:ankyrin repeat protein [Achlya hypogyna]|uniref:Ankyrin repeat protein n=1 Tax=Achlya hypogyna TaxID=1202772 RepID=A0A1V9ZU01_ACHHY|nr:ankyrin repeat protein [Achlya hypogyna]